VAFCAAPQPQTKELTVRIRVAVIIVLISLVTIPSRAIASSQSEAMGSGDQERPPDPGMRDEDVPDSASPGPAPSVGVEFQYAVKFICGSSVFHGQHNGLVARGTYFTAINVHNPSHPSDSKIIAFRKKFAIALPRERVGPVTQFFHTEIGPDEALEIDCADIRDHIKTPPNQLPPPFLKGFAVIESPIELDVLAVYTAGGNHVETIHMERVPARRFVPSPCAGNLNIDLSTGTANWTVVTAPPGFTPTPPFPANLVPSPPWGPSSGVGPWVSASMHPSAVDNIGGWFEYEFRFCLCKDFQNAQLSLTWRTDNEAEISLNGSPPFDTFGSPNVPPAVPVAAPSPSAFQAGTNILTVRVRNRLSSGGAPTPTGMALGGTVSATNGLCPVQ
jgi:hypothetical protein